MNIQDRLHEAMLRNHPECFRCEHDAKNGRPVILGATTSQIAEWAQLCPACLIDLDWFFTHPPEQPDISSGSMSETREG